MKQIVKLDDCLKCRECCRFYKGYQHLAPIIEKEGKYSMILCKEKRGSYYICPYFKKNICIVEKNKPFDCKIYPFNIMVNREGAIVLAYDRSCKGLKGKTKKEIEKYADYLIKYIKKMGILKNKFYVEPFQKELTIVRNL